MNRSVNIWIREPKLEDENAFIEAMQRSKTLHHPWVKAPQTHEEFNAYLQRSKQENQKCFLVCDQASNIIGVFNISEIVRGFFQNAYLGFYAVAEYASHGYMSAGLKLVLSTAFNEMKLHRLEANIQPENIPSIQLVMKNGFRKEGYSPRYLKINNEWRDHERWAITVEDWMSSFGYIETPNLQLRRPMEADALILSDLWRNEKVRQFLGGIISNEMINEKITSIQNHWDKYQFGLWSVVKKDHNEVIGVCGLHHSDDGIELSYMFFPSWWGKGFAKEALMASLNYGFNTLGINKIIAITQEANHNSRYLLENMGMHHVNSFTRFDATQLLYELTQGEWCMKHE